MSSTFTENHEWLARTAMGLVVGLFNTAVIAASPAISDGDLAALIKSLPEVTARTPDPWVPFEAEWASGASWCPDESPAARHATRRLMRRACRGRLPRSLARVLLAIPEKQIFIPRDVRAGFLGEDVEFTAIPGHGKRPDILAKIDYQEGIFIRSLEGHAEKDSIFLVMGPFQCLDHRRSVLDYQFFFEHGKCRTAISSTRAYRWSPQGKLRDETAKHLPLPTLTKHDRAFMEFDTLGVEWSGLNHAPVLRWKAHLKHRPESTDCPYDPIEMPDSMPAERRLHGALHFGFVIWNGKRFELKQRVTHSQWPDLSCDPRRTAIGCESERERSSRDPFVND